MHLEDRLQELYFKSKMLSEYLKGQMRVHVKELGVVLGYGHRLPWSSGTNQPRLQASLWLLLGPPQWAQHCAACPALVGLASPRSEGT